MEPRAPGRAPARLEIFDTIEEFNAAIGILGSVGFDMVGGGADFGGVDFEGVGFAAGCDGIAAFDAATGFEGVEILGGILVGAGAFDAALGVGAGLAGVRGFDGAADESDAVGLYDVVFVPVDSKADIADSSRTWARILEFSWVIGGGVMDGMGCASKIVDEDVSRAAADDANGFADSVVVVDFMMTAFASTKTGSFVILDVFVVFALVGVVATLVVFFVAVFLATGAVPSSNNSPTTFFGLPLFFAVSVEDILTKLMFQWPDGGPEILKIWGNLQSRIFCKETRFSL